MILFLLLLIAWLCGPIMYLRWVWRRWGSVWVLVLHSVLLPGVVYCVSAILGMGGAWLDIGWPEYDMKGGEPWERRLWTGNMYGMFGAAFSLMPGFMLPFLALWKMIAPAHFDAVWQPDERPLTGEQADYRDD